MIIIIIIIILYLYINLYLVRLVGSDNQLQGRVEVFVHDEWGTVCTHSWDDRDANVVCRQLGYAAGKVGPYMGSGEGNILFDEVDCTGGEDSIIHCVNDGTGRHNCGPQQVASVICGLQGKNELKVHDVVKAL